MRVVTAIEPINLDKDAGEVLCFLAGGITNCPDWQAKVIANFKLYDKKFPGSLDNLVLANPRRENFPIDDPNASREQITWEFNALQDMDIFSMYFTAGPSDQPICLYELGRNLMRMQIMHGTDYHKRIVISCDPGYSRAADVKIQTELMWTAYYGMRTVPARFFGKPDIIDKADPLEHMYHIIRAYEYVKGAKNA